MESIDRYLSLVLRMTSVSFCKEEEGFFLLKRPNKAPSEASIPTQISYETVHASIDIDPFAGVWGIARVKKREGNPYADRISIGRAVNCDVVLRAPFISKVQAHILCSLDGSHLLRANSAANSTSLNGRGVDPNSPRPLTVGDSITFGPMMFEFVDAARLYEVLVSEARRRTADKV